MTVFLRNRNGVERKKTTNAMCRPLCNGRRTQCQPWREELRNEAHPYPCLSKPLARILDHLVLADAHRLEIQLTACRRLVDLVMAAQSRADDALLGNRLQGEW